MTEPNEAMKAMADRIADKMYPRTHPGWIGGQHCALAAIMETQEACAKLADNRIAEIKALYGDDIGMSDMRVTCEMEAERFATAIRTGEHYAAIGGGRG